MNGFIYIFLNVQNLTIYMIWMVLLYDLVFYSKFFFKLFISHMLISKEKERFDELCFYYSLEMLHNFWVPWLVVIVAKMPNYEVLEFSITSLLLVSIISVLACIFVLLDEVINGCNYDRVNCY